MSLFSTSVTTPGCSLPKNGDTSDKLIPGDLTTPGCSSPKDGDTSDKLMPGNLQSSVSSSLPSTDPDDTSYYTDQDLRESTTNIYTWNYLHGRGRLDSNVDSGWIINDIDVGRDLMDFKDRVVQVNGGLTETHEKLAVNFIFLIEGDHQNVGLHTEVEDESWAALCVATRSQVSPLPKGTVDEAHQWVHFLAQEGPESFREHLRTSPPTDTSLKSILNLMISSGQLWNSQPCNEDTYLKSRLGSFLETYLSGIRFTTNDWTQVQEDTRNEDSDLLIPDFSTTTVAQKKELSFTSTDYLCILLAHEMKLALDSILLLLPKDNICVVGILVRGTNLWLNFS
ncbi:hypothetical protein BGZ76_002206 [Entomortierella beljakovae]|nr:hypothetical protein BGZ76_002206 [Entomortierella beljakovae]